VEGGEEGYVEKEEEMRVSRQGRRRI